MSGVIAALVLWIGLSLVLYRTPTTPRVRGAAPRFHVGIPRSAVDISQLTRQAIQDGAKIIVWPQAAIEGDPQVAHSAHFRQLAAHSRAYLARGYFVPVTARAWRNEATMLAPDGRFLGIFGKDHPVLFAGETSRQPEGEPAAAGPSGALRRAMFAGSLIAPLTASHWRAVRNSHHHARQRAHRPADRQPPSGRQELCYQGFWPWPAWPV